MSEQVRRPNWANTNALLSDYYDTEWGNPIFDERGIYERICLESFQAGLSWLTVLKKRPAFRKHFNNFDPEIVAEFGEPEIAQMLAEPEIIRNRPKINAAIANAQATLALRESQPLPYLVWSFRPEETKTPSTSEDVPTQTAESVALSKRLKKEGFKFVGPSTAYALMQAIGMVDDHPADSPRRGTSGVFDENGRAVDVTERIRLANPGLPEAALYR